MGEIWMGQSDKSTAGHYFLDFTAVLIILGGNCKCSIVNIHGCIEVFAARAKSILQLLSR
jgi:hypothetical protein